MTPRLGVAALLVALLAITGCAATPVPSPTSEPVVAETPSPTPVAQTAPQSALPVSCADLFSIEEASELIGVPVVVKIAEDTVRNAQSIELRRAGALSCVWGGDDMTDSSWNDSLVVDVLPDAEDAFDVGVWQVNDGAVVYPEGTLSEYSCNSLPGLGHCFANLLSNGYWAQVRVNSATAGDAELREILDSLNSTIGAAGAARAVWEPPAGAIAGAYCAQTEVPEVVPSYLPLVAAARAAPATCAAPEGWHVAVHAGDAWALAGLAAYGDRPWWGLPTLQPTQISGADEALWANPVDGGGYAIVSAGGSAIVLSGPVPVGDEFTAKAAEILAAVVAAG